MVAFHKRSHICMNLRCSLLLWTHQKHLIECCKLFNLLLARNICPLYARLLLYMYTHHKLSVQWNNMYSDYLSLTNSVNRMVLFLHCYSVYIYILMYV